MQEQALALVHDAFQLSGAEDPAIDQDARNLIERIQARVLAIRPRLENDYLENAPSAARAEGGPA